MPKHTQSDHAPRQIRMSLRKLAHTRAHRLSHQLYRGEVEMGDGTTPLADAEMDTSELGRCLSEMSLETPDDNRRDLSSVDPNTTGQCKTTCKSAEAAASMEQASVASDPPLPPQSAVLTQALKANSSLRSRVLMLERREKFLESQLILQKDASARVKDEAAGAKRLVLVAEERFREFERVVEKLRQESYEYSDPSDPGVNDIVASSRARFLAFSSGEIPATTR